VPDSKTTCTQRLATAATAAPWAFHQPSAADQFVRQIGCFTAQLNRRLDLDLFAASLVDRRYHRPQVVGAFPIQKHLSIRAPHAHLHRRRVIVQAHKYDPQVTIDILVAPGTKGMGNTPLVYQGNRISFHLNFSALAIQPKIRSPQIPTIYNSR
jgi:hypothetical protein